VSAPSSNRHLEHEPLGLGGGAADDQHGARRRQCGLRTGSRRACIPATRRNLSTCEHDTYLTPDTSRLQHTAHCTLHTAHCTALCLELDATHRLQRFFPFGSGIASLIPPHGRPNLFCFSFWMEVPQNRTERNL